MLDCVIEHEVDELIEPFENAGDCDWCELGKMKQVQQNLLGRR